MSKRHVCTMTVCFCCVLVHTRYLLQRKTFRDLNHETLQVKKRSKAEKRAKKRMELGAAVVELEDLTDDIAGDVAKEYKEPDKKEDRGDEWLYYDYWDTYDAWSEGRLPEDKLRASTEFPLEPHTGLLW